MSVFSGGDAIKEFLTELDEWLSQSVDMYLLGGSAMTALGLKDQTEDIDLALAVTEHFEHAFESLRAQGFTVTAEPTEPFDNVGVTVELRHPKRGLQLDLFSQQVVGKVWITDRMRSRAEEFWSGTRVNAYTLSDEDMFLLKAVSGGDLASGRHRDIEDMRIFAQRGLDYDVIVEEIQQQRPFNTGEIEAMHIRNKSHPLLAIETATTQLTGLPSQFTTRISAFATEFEVEYAILTAIDDGIYDKDNIQNRVHSTVRTLSEDDKEIVEDAIERLIQKQVVIRGEDQQFDARSF